MNDSGETDGEDSGETGRGVPGDLGEEDTETSSSEEASGNRKDRETEGEGDTVDEGKA